MIELFEKWFHHNQEANIQLSKDLLFYEDDITDYCLVSMSHIINIEHIWLKRILCQTIESSDWDVLPLNYFIRFHRENQLLFENVMLNFEKNQLIRYLNSDNILYEKHLSDLLYHIINHSSHHRAQIIREMKLIGLIHTPMNYVELAK